MLFLQGQDAPPRQVAPGASGVTWLTKTTTYTAVSGNYILADTSGGAFTITLPASPAAGDFVVIADPKGTWDTAALTLGKNSLNIEGAAADLTCDVEYGYFTIIYRDATTGWKVSATPGAQGNQGPGSFSLSGHTAGTSTVTNATGGIVFSGGPNITLSGDPTNTRIAIIGPQVSYLEFFEQGATGTALLGAGTMMIVPFDVPTEITMSRLNLFASFALAGFTSASSAASRTFTVSGSQGINVVLYSQGTGTSSTALYTMLSTQWSNSFKQSISESGVSYTASNTLQYATSITASNAYGTKSTSWTASINATANQTALFTSMSSHFTGWRQIYFPMPITMSAGHYWLGVQRVTAATTSAGIQFSNIIQSLFTQISWGYPGAATNASVGPMGFAAGQSSVSFISAIPASLNLSDVTFIASMPYGNFMNYGL
jgi:hypothetical protein